MLAAVRWMRSQDALIPLMACSPPPAQVATLPKEESLLSNPSAWETTYAVDSASSSASARLSNCSLSRACAIS